jgi:hypothetical protein
MKRFLLLFAAVSLAVASAANSFKVDLAGPTMIGGTELKAGQAKVELQDGKAVVHQGKTSVEAAVKVETNKNKYAYTVVGYQSSGDHKIKDICVGGTTTHILFE